MIRDHPKVIVVEIRVKLFTTPVDSERLSFCCRIVPFSFTENFTGVSNHIFVTIVACLAKNGADGFV